MGSGGGRQADAECDGMSCMQLCDGEKTLLHGLSGKKVVAWDLLERCASRRQMRRRREVHAAVRRRSAVTGLDGRRWWRGSREQYAEADAHATAP